MRAVSLAVVALALWLDSSRCGAAQAPVPAGAEKLDAAMWTRRNLDVLRRTLPEEQQKEEEIRASLAYNPLLKRDPYAAELAAIVEAYVQKGGGEAGNLGELVKTLRKPQAERIELLRPDSDGRQREREAGPVVAPTTISQVILELRPRERTEREAALLDKMEAVARQRQDWGRLGLAYLELASYVKPWHPERADRYLRRLLEVLREHPIYQDPRHGNSDAVSPLSVAGVMLRFGPREALEQFIQSVGAEFGGELATALAAVLARDGDFESARTVIEKHVRPASAKSAERIGAALRGDVAPAPAGSEEDPVELRLRDALRMIVPAHAVRGDVETAARMKIALQDKKRGAVASRVRDADHDVQQHRAAGCVGTAPAIQGLPQPGKHAKGSGRDRRCTATRVFA